MVHTRTLLDERAAEWRRLPRTTPQERAAAEAYYEARVLPLLGAAFAAREHVHLRRRYEGLIVAIGPDPAPAVLSLAAIEPARAHLLYTLENEPAADRAAAALHRLAAPCGRTRIGDQAILEAYAAVRDVYRAWREPRAVAVDITGGPAALSAGMAMAGYTVGADLVAVEAEELWPDVGRARPGSEHLTFPPQPYRAFGDLAQQEARQAYARRGYALASDLYALLAESVDEVHYGAYRDLAAAYQAWDVLDPARAWPAMLAAVGAVQTSPGHPLAPHLARLQAQAAALERLQTLSEEDTDTPGMEALTQIDLVADLVFSLWANTERRAEEGCYSVAILLQYRLLELMAQRRLAMRGLDTYNPDYARLGRPDLAEALAGLQSTLLGEQARIELPRQIGLTTGLLLLQLLGDPLTEALDWPLLRWCMAGRSRSVLVHGFRWADRSLYLDCERLLAPIIERFAQAEGLDCDGLWDTHRFVPAACRHIPGVRRP